MSTQPLALSPSPFEVSKQETTVGWVSENGGRGTLSLILTCTFTIFLCTWVVIHPRVTKNTANRNLHKFALFLKTIVAPEFITVEALQEWSQARKMVAGCAESTGGQLKLVHAFYVGMLGVKYRTSKGERVIWPNQYEWLLNQGLVKWENHAAWGLSEENIADKNKSDGTVKLAALLQVLWFLAQCLMRRAHLLPLSQYESMTISYIPLFAVTYFLWWVKPKDIMAASLVDLPDMRPEQFKTFEDLAVSHVFDTEGTEEQLALGVIWQLTPRVFEKEARDKALQEAQQEFAKKNAKEKSPRQGSEASSDVEANKEAEEVVVTLPEETVLAHWDPDLYHSKIIWPLSCLLGSSFGALHLISWNSHFPSEVELWLWRGAAIASIVTLLVFMHFEKVVVRGFEFWSIIGILSPALYLLSRIIMIAGVIAAFRAMEPKIYETYVVSDYWISMF